LVVLLLILGAEFVNGWTDAPNAIATVVSTRSLPPRVAVVMATVLNLVGVMSGTAVAKTIGTDIVRADVVDLTTVGASMVGIILWSTLAANWGLPTSESHALVAGLAGGGLAAAGPSALLWIGWQKVLIGLLLSSVLGFVGGGLIMSAVYWIFRSSNPHKMKGWFRGMQVGSSAFMAFSHGSNDGQKFMGAFTLALLLSGKIAVFDIPYWVVLLCGTTMALGTMTGGWKIIRTMGYRVTELKTHQGFAAELAAASTIEFASRLGIPLSTTHTISTAIMGVASVKNIRSVRWNVCRDIVLAWVLTFPVCGLISWCTVKVARIFF
jgi:PiT family inorganic phosphate transporter